MTTQKKKKKIGRQPDETASRQGKGVAWLLLKPMMETKNRKQSKKKNSASKQKKGRGGSFFLPKGIH
jgi:hypothetical protein